MFLFVMRENNYYGERPQMNEWLSLNCDTPPATQLPQYLQRMLLRDNLLNMTQNGDEHHHCLRSLDAIQVMCKHVKCVSSLSR